MGSKQATYQAQDDRQTLCKYPIMVRVMVMVRVRVRVMVRVKVRIRDQLPTART